MFQLEDYTKCVYLDVSLDLTVMTAVLRDCVSV